ncbi:MAG TPA: hypothetical protein VHT03_09705 [Rhizomicrobium sp.]|nr:hypothetical protein [Rhizomicrobium sp.]
MASSRFHKRVTLFVASFPALCIWVPAFAGMTRFFIGEALFSALILSLSWFDKLTMRNRSPHPEPVEG